MRRSAPWELTNEDRQRPIEPAHGERRRKRRALHALIPANLEEGHLLPRTLGELDACTPSDSSSRSRADARSSAARSSRRSARTSPRCDRSPSTRSARGNGVGDADRRRAARRARRRRLRKAVRVHARAGLFHPRWASRSCRTLAAREDLHRLREVPAVPPVRPVRDGRAARIGVDDERDRGLPAAVARTRALVTSVRRRSIAAASRRRADFAPPASAPASRPSGALDLALLVSDTPATGGGRVHDQPAQAAPVLVSREHLARSAAAWRAPSSSTAAAPTPAPATTACATRATMAADTARLARLRRRAGAGRLDRRHRRALPMDKIRAGAAARPSARSAPIRAPTAARAIMTTDPFPKEAAARVDDRRPRRSRSAAWPRARA